MGEAHEFRKGHARSDDPQRAGTKELGQEDIGFDEFVDIFPSLVDICGLPKADGQEGLSFAPLLDDPNRKWKEAAFSQYPRQVPGVGRVMGYSMRTERYRLTEWMSPDRSFYQIELYDYKTDPDERVNLAADGANGTLVKKLKEKRAVLAPRLSWEGTRR